MSTNDKPNQMARKHKFHQHIPPFVLILIFISIYYIFVIGFCHLLIKDLLESCLYQLFHNIFFIMLTWSFIATVLTPVMEVPDEYTLSEAEDEIYFISNENRRRIFLEDICRRRNITLHTRTSRGYIRYCRICRQIKPDRAHHCSSCEVCVLKMDHHCPWANNCIGFSNEKYFVLTLFYASLYCIYVTSTTLKYFCSYWEHGNDKYIPVVVGFLVTLFLEIMIFAFFLFHCGLVLKNQTTLEQIQDDVTVEGNGSFNNGRSQNFKQVFGDDWHKWLLPVFTAEGNGCVFPLSVHS